MNDYKEIISRNIKRYRKAAGMSQVELAKKLGITSASISNWEKGQNSIDVDMLFRLCSILNVPIDNMGLLESPAASHSPVLRQDETELLRMYNNISESHQKDLLAAARVFETSEKLQGSSSDVSGDGDISDDKESEDGIA